MKTGDRVELHPGCDLWMRGAKYGTITKVDEAKQIAHVRMDYPQVKRVQRVPFDRLTLIG